MIDQIVDEVRQIRLKIEQECAKAGVSYKEHLLAVQKQYEDRLVKAPPHDDKGMKVG